MVDGIHDHTVFIHVVSADLRLSTQKLDALLLVDLIEDERDGGAPAT